MADDQSIRAKEMWKTCLNAAFRTTLACTIVGAATLYGPAVIRHQVAFPAFSYVTVILIVTNARLGDTLRGCWQAVYATAQGTCPAIFCLWLIGPTRLTASSTALVVALSSFFVALPERTHLIGKRIALGQVVIVYVVGYINGEKTKAVMHPVHVAASTAAGVVACVLALLLPYPQLACVEVKQNCKLLAENASERLKLFVKAFCAEDSATSQAFISQAKSLSIKGTKFLQCIKSKQESMQWETLPIKWFKRSCCINPGDQFEELETVLRGMEVALTSSSFPVTILDEEWKDGVNRIQEQVSKNFMNQKGSWLPHNTSTVPESDAGQVVDDDQFLQTVQILPQTHEDLPCFFFLFCLRLLQKGSRTTRIISKHDNPAPGKDDPDSPCKENVSWSKRLWINLCVKFNPSRLIPALKCSLSLGFAVLLGLVYSKENGYWAGLPVAISLASAREATFKVANVKAQGTVLGTVYGVLGCFVLQRFGQIRFFALLPWFIFTSFLQQSKMYGQAGAISAVIGAVLILGRKNFGPPREFAIARIIETFIGLLCSIAVEILFRPRRAAALAKTQLSGAFNTLQNCLESIDLLHTPKQKLLEVQKRLKSEVIELGKYIGEAEAEPNFWFQPFHSTCYRKLLGSLSKMADLLLFSAHAIGFLEQKLPVKGDWKEGLDRVNGDLEILKKKTGGLIKCLREITLIKSLSELQKQIEKNNISFDVELGKAAHDPLRFDEDEMMKIIGSLLNHMKEVVRTIQWEEDEEELDEDDIVLSFCAAGFCISGLMKEAREIEKAVKELVQWENPSSFVNLSEISCKIDALREHSL